MARFQIRFAPGMGPDGTKDVVEIEAAMFETNGDYVDFYSEARQNIGGTLNVSGHVVRRVRSDILIDVAELG